MELQFDKITSSCLRWAVREVQNQEQTQEVRLNDGMPDIGRVLGTWGQILLRSKEWQAGSIGVSGGVMVWVLYMPEDGSAPQCVETWLPFQMKWDFPDSGRDGAIQTCCLLRSVDARSTSARKLMVRAGIGVQCEAVVQGDAEIYKPGELPQDVQILKKTYPVRLPREAGEKAFAIDEELSLPASCPQMTKLIRYELRPEIVDQKVIAGKAVFRGAGTLHVLYSAEDGGLYSWDFEIPFSQYTELNNDYEESATAGICLAVTNLELDTAENGSLRLKAGLTGQYIIYDCTLMEMTEDAYSPNRSVIPQTSLLQLPAVLDTQQQSITFEQTVELDSGRIADVTFYPDHPQLRRSVDSVQIGLPGIFQILYYDSEGNLQNTVSRAEKQWDFSADQDCGVKATVCSWGKPQAISSGGTVNLRADVAVDALSDASKGLTMLTGLDLGEMREPDEARPSLILRRAGSDSLWEIAKCAGSTVDAIRKANQIQNEPSVEQILLIPIS